MKPLRACSLISAPVAIRLGLVTAFWFGIPLAGAEPKAADAGSPSPQAREAIRLIESEDPYQRELGFLRLEALREPETIRFIRPYAEDRKPDIRAYSLRALAAIQGPEAIPLLLQTLHTDRKPEVRRAALLGLEPFERTSPKILPAFLSALRDHSTEVRISAVDVVSRIDDPRAREAIRMRNRR